MNVLPIATILVLVGVASSIMIFSDSFNQTVAAPSAGDNPVTITTPTIGPESYVTVSTDTIAPFIQTESTKIAGPSVRSTDKFSQKDIDAWLYPNAIFNTMTSETADLTSRDDTTKITDWYKARISSGKYSVKNSVSTSTNGNVNTVLTAAENDRNIRITIEKKQNDPMATIVVSIK